MRSSKRTLFKGRRVSTGIRKRVRFIFRRVWPVSTASGSVPAEPSRDSAIVSQLAHANATVDISVTIPSPAPAIRPSLFPSQINLEQPAIEKTSTPWERALKQLQPEDQAGIDFQKSSKIDLLGEFIRETEKIKQICEKNQWCSVRNGEKVYYGEILLTQLNKYAAIGDIAIQANPPVVALVWAGFRFLLQVATADLENVRLVFGSLEYLVRVLSRCDIYEKLYAGRGLQATELLNTSLESLYVSILQYLCCARRELSDKPLFRILRSVLSDTGQLFKKIQECEKVVGNDADTAQKESAAIGSLFQEESTKVLKRLLAKIYESVEEAKRLRILMWLSGVPFQDHHSYFQERRHSDTGYWLVQHDTFSVWRSSLISSILWLRGDDPRLLMSSNLKKTRAVAYFYCNYREEERRDPASIMRALIKQLCLAFPGWTLPNPVLSIYRRREDNGHASGSLSLNECKDLIIDLLAGFLQTTIVIDALDECNRSTRRDLFHTLKQILDLSTNTRIFVTSRNDGDIRNALNGLPSHYINAADNTKDIDTYINSEIEKCFDEGLLPKDGDYVTLKRDIILTLSKGANGMFMWAHFQILAICEEHTPGNIRKALARLPKDLNETYKRISQKINDQSPDNVNTAEKVLKWLLYTKELSSPEIISEFLSVKPGEATLESDRWTRHQILDICQNLVVYDKGLNVLRFAHFSVQEFLLHQTEFSEEEAHANTFVAEICLTVLTYHHSKTGRCPTPALLKYAIPNWPNKVQLSGGGSSTLKVLWKNFMNHSSAHYRAWVSVVRFRDELASKRGVISPLWVAHYYQLYDLFKFLLDNGADPNWRNSRGETLVLRATVLGHNSFVKLLVKLQDLDINHRDNHDLTPLTKAVESGPEMVQTILENKNVDPESVQRELKSAVMVGRGEVAQLLVRDYRVGLKGIQRALGSAVTYGLMEMVQLLLGDDRVDLKSVQKALELAITKGDGEVVQLLKEKAAELTQKVGKVNEHNI